MFLGSVARCLEESEMKAGRVPKAILGMTWEALAARPQIQTLPRCVRGPVALEHFGEPSRVIFSYSRQIE